MSEKPSEYVTIYRSSIEYEPNISYLKTGDKAVEVCSTPSNQEDSVIWNLRINVRGVPEYPCSASVSVFLGLEEADYEPIYASYAFSWLNDNKQAVRTETGSNKFTVLKERSNNYVKINEFGVQKLYELFTSAEQARTDAFRIKLRCEIMAELYTIIPKCTLINDVKSLLSDSEFTDIVFHVQGKKYSAHKAILAQRSPVFKAMFSNEMKEKVQNEVFIEDIESDTFLRLLSYIYTGSTKMEFDVAENLLQVAEKYDVGRLKLACEKILSKHLTIENIVKYLLLADTHNASYLRVKAIDYICKHVVKIIETSEWLSMLHTNPDLTQECFKAVVSKYVK